MNRPSDVEQLLDRCVHFRAMEEHATCAAGVRYADVRVNHEPIPYQSTSGATYQARVSYPCHGRHNHGGAVCPMRATMPREEAEARAREMQRELAYMAEARMAIVAQTENRGGRGIVACPKCGERLGYSQAASNRHVHARCATPGCLAWME